MRPLTEFIGLGPDYGHGRVARFQEQYGRAFVLNRKSLCVRRDNRRRDGRDTAEEDAALAAMDGAAATEGESKT